MFFCEFCKIRNNTFFAEHHHTTASDYSSINSFSNEGRIGKQNCKLWCKNHILIWAKVQVIKMYTPGETTGFRGSRSQVFKNFINFTGKHVFESLSLQIYEKETSIQVFFCKIYKISKNTFFIGKLQWLLLRFNSCFQRSPGQKLMRLSSIRTRFSWKRYLLPRKSGGSFHRCSVKEGIQLY